MKRTLLLILALILTLALVACGSSGDDYDYDYDDYEDEYEDYEDDAPQTTEPEEEPFESVIIEGEGSIEMSVGSKKMTFTLPNEISHYSRINQTSRETAVMTHDTATKVSGRTIITLDKDTFDAGTVLEKFGNFSGTLDKSYKESVNSAGKEVVSEVYEYALDVGDGYMLFVTIDVTYKKDVTTEFSDDTINVILANCEFH